MRVFINGEPPLGYIIYLWSMEAVDTDHFFWSVPVYHLGVYVCVCKAYIYIYMYIYIYICTYVIIYLYIMHMKNQITIRI